MGIISVDCMKTSLFSVLENDKLMHFISLCLFLLFSYRKIQAAHY